MLLQKTNRYCLTQYLIHNLGCSFYRSTTKILLFGTNWSTFPFLEMENQPTESRSLMPIMAHQLSMFWSFEMVLLFISVSQWVFLRILKSNNLHLNSKPFAQLSSEMLYFFMSVYWKEKMWNEFVLYFFMSQFIEMKRCEMNLSFEKNGMMLFIYLFKFIKGSWSLHTHTHTKSPKSTLAGIFLPDFLPNLFESTPLCLLACWQQWLMVLVRVLVSPFLLGKDSDDSANAFWL